MLNERGKNKYIQPYIYSKVEVNERFWQNVILNFAKANIKWLNRNGKFADNTKCSIYVYIYIHMYWGMLSAKPSNHATVCIVRKVLSVKVLARFAIWLIKGDRQEGTSSLNRSDSSGWIHKHTNKYTQICYCVLPLHGLATFHRLRPNPCEKSRFFFWDFAISKSILWHK